MDAALVITGSEMLSGFRQDALVQPFAAMLNAKGIPVREVRMLGDAPERLVHTLTEIKADFIVVTGGLGLTPDDTTAQVVDALADQGTRQSLQNPVGSALGIDLRLKHKRIMFLPGVPAEAFAMFRNLMAQFADQGAVTVNIPVFGLKEVEIARRLGELAPQCGYLPKDMEITVVVPQAIETAVRRILGRHCLEDTDLATSLGGLLKGRGLRLATAESCTGGLIAHLITQVPGSSDYFLGAAVTYSNALKVKVLGVPEMVLARHGAVSQEVAAAMLKGVLDLTGADVGIATTGIAGPTGGSHDKPVGTVWIAAGTGDNPQVRNFQFGFGRLSNQLISAKAGLNMLRLMIYDQDLHRTALA
ncbi:MAG: nicotinamide-nucleotide amidohydrolase family protein [Syntrophaceae bacterium]